jgi:hypothetical protein
VIGWSALAAWRGVGLAAAVLVVTGGSDGEVVYPADRVAPASYRRWVFSIEAMIRIATTIRPSVTKSARPPPKSGVISCPVCRTQSGWRAAGEGVKSHRKNRTRGESGSCDWDWLTGVLGFAGAKSR